MKKKKKKKKKKKRRRKEIIWRGDDGEVCKRCACSWAPCPEGDSDTNDGTASEVESSQPPRGDRDSFTLFFFLNLVLAFDTRRKEREASPRL